MLPDDVLPDGKPRLKPWHKWALRLIVTAVLIGGIFWLIPLSDVLSVLRNVKPGYLAAGFAVYMFSNFFQAVQLWLLLRRLELPHGPWHVFEVNMITRFYGQFLPSELMAGAVKLYRLAGPEKQWGEVLAAMGFFRFMNLITLVLIGVVFWAIDLPTGPGRWIGLVMGGMAVALVGAHLLLASPALSTALRRLIPGRGLEWLKGRLAAKAKKLISTVVDSYRLFKDMVSVIGAFAMMRHALGILYFGLYALSLDIHLSFLTIGWIRVVLQVLLMLPISLSGLGVREGSLVILLQEYGVSASEAVALSLVIFLTTVLGNALGGLLEAKNVLLPGRESGPAGSPE